MASKTWREMRVFPQSWPIDESKAQQRKTMHWQDGELREGFKIDGQVMHIDFSRVYPDDVLAVMRDMIHRLQAVNPDPHNREAARFIDLAIFEMDKRAVEKHNFSWDPKEQAVIPPYLSSKLDA